MSTNQNAAYDLSLFEPRQEYRREKKKTGLRVLPQPKKRRVSAAAVLKSAAVGAMVVTALCCIMISNVKLTELNDQVKGMQNNLNTAKSEQISLQMKLESRMSLKSVEDYAVNTLGLTKVQNYQVTYINMNEGDKVVVSGENAPHSLKDFIFNLVDNIKAYFG